MKMDLKERIDEVKPSVLVGFIGFWLLKNGYTADSVARALHVPEIFTSEMSLEGIKKHGFPNPSKVCKKMLDVFFAADVTENEFRISFMLTNVPEMAICVAEENGINEEHIIAHSQLAEKAGDSFDPLTWLDDAPLKSFEEEFDFFIKQQCVFGTTNQCDVKEFFDAWTEWAKDRSIEQPSTQVVGKRLKNLFPGIDTAQYRTASGHSRKYIGIGLKEKRS